MIGYIQRPIKDATIIGRETVADGFVDRLAVDVDARKAAGGDIEAGLDDVPLYDEQATQQGGRLSLREDDIDAPRVGDVQAVGLDRAAAERVVIAREGCARDGAVRRGDGEFMQDDGVGCRRRLPERGGARLKNTGRSLAVIGGLERVDVDGIKARDGARPPGL